MRIRFARARSSQRFSHLKINFPSGRKRCPPRVRYFREINRLYPKRVAEWSERTNRFSSAV